MISMDSISVAPRRCAFACAMLLVSCSVSIEHEPSESTISPGSGGTRSGGLQSGGASTSDADSDAPTVPDDASEPRPEAYTIRLRGALIAPFDDYGDAWDLTASASDNEKSALRLVAQDYTSSKQWLESTSNGWDPPEVFGDARLSVGSYPEQDVILEPESAANSTFSPQWINAGWKHVRLADSLQILVSLYDSDVNTPDAIGYVLLGVEDIRSVVALGGLTALPVYQRTNNRVLWLAIEAEAEDVDAGEYAPASIGMQDIPRDLRAEVADSKTTTLWVRGLDFFGGTGVVLPWGDDSYWTKSSVTPTGPNPTCVNYHARAYLGVSNIVVQYALNRYCIAPSKCIVACHSAGCAQIGYSLAEYGRLGTQWAIERVIAGGSAAGGSELATDVSFTGLIGFLGRDLEVARMRALFDHDSLGVQVDQNVGAWGGPRAALLPGEDDDSVAYHSAGGARLALAYCNPGDLFCDGVLPQSTFDPALLFTGHRVVYRDDSESYDHEGTKKKVAEWVTHEFSSP